MKRRGHGDLARFALLRSCVVLPILTASGQPYLKVFPHLDPRVHRVVRKVVRGLEHARDGSIIPDDHVRVRDAVPFEDAHLMEPQFNVPNAFDSRVFDCRHAYKPDDAKDEQLRSIWLVRFFEVALMAIVYSKVAKPD